MSSSHLNWGIIGTGFIAHQFAAGLRASRTGMLTAVASRDAASAKTFAEKYRDSTQPPVAYGTYAALLADPQVQAVYISAPHPFHAEWSLQAMRAGKHVLCEKPMAMNTHEARSVVTAAADLGLLFMEAYMYRCHPQMAELVTLLRNQAIGQVRFIRCSFSFHSPRPFNTTSRLTNRALGGGGILDVGGYCTSACGLIAGVISGHTYAEPRELEAMGKIGPESQVDEYTSATLRYDNDLIASIQCGVQVDMDNTLSIYGTDGRLVLRNPWVPGPQDGHIVLIRLDSVDPTILTPHADRSLYALEADAFADTLFAGQKQPVFPAMNHADSLANLHVMDRWRSAIGMCYEQDENCDKQ